jgi:hypothetical protein
MAKSTNDKSKVSGDWNDSNTWNNGVPDSSSDVTIAAGDQVSVVNGLTAPALASSVTVKSGADLILNNGALQAGSLTVAGVVEGSGKIDGNLLGGGEVIAQNGNLELTGAVGADNKSLLLEIENGATLKLDGAVGAAGSLLEGTDKVVVDFGSGNATLDLSAEGAGASGEMQKFQAEVKDFNAGDKILLASSGQAGDSVHFNAKTDMLTVTNASGQVIDQIEFKGNYKGVAFSLAEANGVDTITNNAICFYAGTLIATPEGGKAVETLKAGDVVLTSEGETREVVWLGRQTISTVFSDPEKVWPIRVKAGALGESVPSRDLVVSPDHALLVDGVLIHAGALVNGGSIVRQTMVPRIFTYYHVEVADHALILAENTPAETFIDHPERLAFDNWDERKAIFPFGKDVEELAYARAKSPRQVPVHVRVTLAERAQTLGLKSSQVA